MDSATWDDRYSERDLVWGAAPNVWVARVCEGLTPGRAIDLACGEGRNSIWLAGRGWTVTGVDFSAVALARAENLAGQQPDLAGRLSWVQADLREYRPDPAATDLVLVAYLHVSAEQRRGVLRAAVTGLAPGGLLLVVGHDSSNLTEGVGGPQQPDVLYTAADLTADLAGVAGLAVERAERVVRTVPGAPADRQALDALLLARRTG